MNLRQVLSIIGIIFLLLPIGLLYSEDENSEVNSIDIPPLPNKVTSPSVPIDEEAPLHLEIYGGIRELYKIAVPLPLGDKEIGEKAQSIMIKDLELVGMFNVLDPRSYLADPIQEGLGIELDKWTAIGAQAVIKARIKLIGVSELRAEFRLYEIARGESAVLIKHYRDRRANLRTVIYKFLNEVIRYFTGEPGVFGTRIAFARRIAPGRKEIFTVNWDGSDLKQITNNHSINVLPAWLPGGGLLYTSYKSGNANLYRTGRKEPILSYEGLNMGARVSPDGSKMAVVLTKDGNAEIYLVTLNGKIIKRLTHNPAIDVSPTWSPDGRQIAFVSNRDGTPQIYVMNADGSNVRRLTYVGSYNQTPAWCPRKDNPVIAFAGRDAGVYDIFTVNVKTGEIIRLTQYQGSNMDPTWSPDGRLIAFWSSRGGIFIMNPDGTNQRKVLPGHAETLRWAPRWVK